jgi:hypothetical protein
LLHVDAITAKKGEQLAQIVLPWAALEAHDQA